MKIKAKELFKRFLEVESLKDVGGMDPDLAKECTEIALIYFSDYLANVNYKAVDELSKIAKINNKKQNVNYATKEDKE